MGKKLDEMTEEEIVQEAQERGYTIREREGKTRVGNTPITSGADLWMNKANVRLWEMEKGHG